VRAQSWGEERRAAADDGLQVVTALRDLHRLGMARRVARFDPKSGGALALTAAKMSFELDKQTGNPVGVRKYQMFDTNQLVEEFMLLVRLPTCLPACLPVGLTGGPAGQLFGGAAAHRGRAGECVSAASSAAGPQADAPGRAEPRKGRRYAGKRAFSPCADLLLRLVLPAGVQLFRGSEISAAELHMAMQRLANGPLPEQLRGQEQVRPDLLVLTSELLKKPMKVCASPPHHRPPLPCHRQARSAFGLKPEDTPADAAKYVQPAQYFVSCDVEQPLWRHWALNIPYYTHFTSPIRRYADVCVHRELAAVLAGEVVEDQDRLARKTLHEIAERCNEKKQASRCVGRGVDAWVCGMRSCSQRSSAASLDVDRDAQEASDLVYLNVLVRDRFQKGKPYECDALVMDLGPKSFELLLPELGVSKRIHALMEWRAHSADPLLAEGDAAGEAPQVGGNWLAVDAGLPMN
jgi:hypothetical protein